MNCETWLNNGIEEYLFKTERSEHISISELLILLKIIGFQPKSKAKHLIRVSICCTDHVDIYPIELVLPIEQGQCRCESAIKVRKTPSSMSYYNWTSLNARSFQNTHLQLTSYSLTVIRNLLNWGVRLSLNPHQITDRSQRSVTHIEDTLPTLPTEPIPKESTERLKELLNDTLIKLQNSRDLLLDHAPSQPKNVQTEPPKQAKTDIFKPSQQSESDNSSELKRESKPAKTTKCVPSLTKRSPFSGSKTGTVNKPPTITKTTRQTSDIPSFDRSKDKSMTESRKRPTEDKKSKTTTLSKSQTPRVGFSGVSEERSTTGVDSAKQVTFSDNKQTSKTGTIPKPSRIVPEKQTVKADIKKTSNTQKKTDPEKVVKTARTTTVVKAAMVTTTAAMATTTTAVTTTTNTTAEIEAILVSFFKQSDDVGKMPRVKSHPEGDPKTKIRQEDPLPSTNGLSSVGQRSVSEDYSGFVPAETTALAATTTMTATTTTTTPSTAAEIESISVSFPEQSDGARKMLRVKARSEGDSKTRKRQEDSVRSRFLSLPSEDYSRPVAQRRILPEVPPDILDFEKRKIRRKRPDEEEN